MYRTLLIFLFLPALAWGNQTEITVLPDTAAQTGTAYSETLTVAGTKVTSTTNGLYISGHDIVLNLGTDTIAFAHSDSTTGSGSYGLMIGYASYAYNIIVVGGTILADPTDTNTNGMTCYLPAAARNITFQGTHFVTSGYNYHCVSPGDAGTGNDWYLNDFDTCRFTAKGTGYTSRCHANGAAVKYTETISATAGAAEYLAKFYRCIFDTCYGGGMFLTGSTTNGYIVRGCSVVVDNRNDFYTYPSGNACYGTANNGPLTLTWSGPGTIIDSNYFMADTNWGGTDLGMLIQTCWGTAETPLEITANYVDVHSGPDANYGDINSKAIKTRYTNKHLNIHDNYFKSSCASTGDSYCPITVCVEIEAFYDVGADFANQRGPDSNVVYRNNTIIATGLDDGITSAIAVRTSTTDTMGYTYKEAGNRFVGNEIHTPDRAYNLGGYDNYYDGGAAFQADSNTVVFDTTYDGIPHWLVYGQWQMNHTGSVIADGIYTDDYDTSIYLSIYLGDLSVAISRTFDILITDSSDTPLEGAIVEITNNYSQLIGTDTTGADGLVHIPCVYWKEYYIAGDSMAYNPIDYIVIYDNDTTEVENFTLAHDSYTDTTKVGSEGEAEKTNHHISKWRK